MNTSFLIGCRRAPHASGFVRRCFQSLLLPALLGVALPNVEATIHIGTIRNHSDMLALYKKGYLDVTSYGVVAGSEAAAATNTDKINEALIDAYNLNDADLPPAIQGGQPTKGSLVLYFPAGTYYVNDTLKAWTATGRPKLLSDPKSLFDGKNHATPRNHIAMVGSTTGARPVIRLVDNIPAFRGTNPLKVMLDFTNFQGTYDDANNTAGGHVPTLEWALTNVEDSSRGYHQMLRGINLHCGSGNTNAIALKFNQAQESSIENVKITATGANTGILGLPGRGWGAVNLEVVGGDYGIDLMKYDVSGLVLGSSNVGSVVTGLKLSGQKKATIMSDGFVPLSLVGFDIASPTNPDAGQDGAIVFQSGTKPHVSLVNLIDGILRLSSSSHTGIIDTAGRSFYARNVHVNRGTSGTINMIKTGTNYTVASSPWGKIPEFSYTDQVSAQILGEKVGNTQNMVTQSTTRFISGSASSTPAQYPTTPNLVAEASAPTDFLTRHAWLGNLPSVDDTDIYDPVDAGIITLNTAGVAYISTATLNNLFTNNPGKKIFLPKGIYRLNGGAGNTPVTIPAGRVLFGAARFLTRIEVQAVWKPSVATPMIEAESTTSGATYLGDLNIGIDTDDDNGVSSAAPGDWFTALKWQAGANSMVHIGQIYRYPAKNNNPDTNGRPLINITGNGGGRWYFAGCRTSGKGGNAGYRIIKVSGRTSQQPLWFYGMNLEHAGVCREFAEFNTVENVRIYGAKSEYADDDVAAEQCMVFRFQNANNVALFGLGAIRNNLRAGKGSVNFVDCTNSKATLIAPQMDRFSEHDSPVLSGRTVQESLSGALNGVSYPDVVSLYNSPTSGSTPGLDDGAMTHSAIDY